ncbi:hypothetical protein BV898_09670 [Hypsibius exemplaris]|uniref:Uncharacterized protein n=1 Tax=Hypsibius exemplaris TaxID=2072580 RepID=A0A1W0WLV1_HYPEX|nr:hypothetical protein BV898_09670 [Hypsibius exemplaris]
MSNYGILAVKKGAELHGSVSVLPQASQTSRRTHYSKDSPSRSRCSGQFRRQFNPHRRSQFARHGADNNCNFQKQVWDQKCNSRSGRRQQGSSGRGTSDCAATKAVGNESGHRSSVASIGSRAYFPRAR